jgi:H+/Cl- antiporter ClcA
VRKYLYKISLWFIIVIIIALSTGIISAFFLEVLSLVTTTRESNSIWIYFLPIGGLIIGLSYYYLSEGVEGGNNLLITEMDKPKHFIHWKIIPLVLFGTVATHLFGGSAGREGTAVQMGGAIGDQIQKLFKWTRLKRKTLLRMGVAGGFAGVFGTPIAGVIFAVEFARDRKFSFVSILLSTLVAFGSHYTCHFIGVGHTQYRVSEIPDFGMTNIGLILLIGILFGVTAWIFSITKIGFQRIFNLIPTPYLRPFFGGIILLGLFLIFDIDEFLGLGIPSIVEAFDTIAHPGDIWIKLVLTALTLGAGFKGGEATPLFFMGAVLGSTLALWIPLPLSFLAGAGFVAVFGAATNTPIASSFMAAELFGYEGLPLYLIVCIMAFYISGKTTVYATQQPLLRKWSIREKITKRL